MRFSVCTFWPSFVSITCSVGTTTRRNRGDWFMDRMRCSRFVLTLFSCPEYVLITYQRNMPTSLQKDVADEGADQLVDAPEIGTDDEHGDDDDDGSLDRLGPIRPVDLAKLAHRLADEATAPARLVLQRSDRSAARCGRLRQPGGLACRLVTGC